MERSPTMDQSMAASKTTIDARLDEYIYDPKRTLYRHLAMEGKLVTIFDVDDSRSYYNWQLVMGNIRIHRRWLVPSPRFRELIDHELGMVSFEVTGDFDGSVSMICPSAEGGRSMGEELPVINFILNDMECYSSVEITVVTINPASIESGEYQTKLRKIVARNYRSRTVITDTVLKVHFKLRSLWNYAFLNLEELVRDAWGESYLVTKMVKINANARIRRVFFSDQLYSVDDLPKEYVLDINPFPTTTEFFMPTQQYPPDRKPKLRRLYKNLREIDHEIMTQAEYEKMMRLQPLTSEILKNNADRQQEHVKSLILSLISKDDPSPVIVNGRRSADDMKGVVALLPALLASDKNVNLHSNLEGLEKTEFCQAVWNLDQPGAGQLGEWDLIKNFDIKPQTLAQIHRQRRGEGFYDMYSARMLKVMNDELDELDVVNVIPSNQKDLSQKFRELLGDKSLETYMKAKPILRNSSADPDSDLDYFKDKEVTSDVDICKNIGITHCVNDEDDDNDGSHSGESNACSEDTWLLTWTFDGMDQCRKDGNLFDSENISYSKLSHFKTPQKTFENEVLTIPSNTFIE